MARREYSDEMIRELQQAFDLAAQGFTDKAIGDYLGVARGTVSKWINHKPEFQQAVARLKGPLDAQVEASLFQRAIGFETQDTKLTMDADGEVVKTEVTNKRVAGDVTACIFWLKNRTTEWRDVYDRPPTSDLDGESSMIEVARRILFAITEAEHTRH